MNPPPTDTPDPVGATARAPTRSGRTAAAGADAARWRRPPEPGWSVGVAGDDPLRRRVTGALLTVADGRFGTRGTREECDGDCEPWVMAAGVYRQVPGDIPRPVPGPLWFHLDVPTDDAGSERRWLDLARGVLHRERRGAWHYRSVRFASLARPGIAVQRSVSDCPLGVTDAAVLPVTDGVRQRRWSHEDVEVSQTSGVGTITAATCTRWQHHDGRHVVDRLASLGAHPTRAPTTDTVLAALEEARSRGVERLLAEHEAAWASRWADAAIAIPGDPDLELGVRFGLFHLMASAAGHDEAAVGARGLTGPAYAGHVFWDADVFVLPFLAATHPPAARAMLEYRLRRLPAARTRARAEGRAGCRPPWESAVDGSEAAPTSTVTLDGTELPVRTGELEEHIVADVAWAAWHHHLWSGDRWVTQGAGRALLVETARYWASRLEQDTDGTVHLRGVIGPDEYHEDVDDNAYTNVMVRWHLRRAAELDGHDDEASVWRDLADRLVDGYDPQRGGHEQFAGYRDLEPLEVAAVGAPPLAADVLLGRDRVARSQLIKQADVLLLHHLVPDAVPAGSLRHDLEVYLPRTVHGSSLSPAVHASLLARERRPEEAAALLRLTARIDLDDITATTAGGLHLGAMGGLWQALAFGFLGLRPHPGGLALDPRPLPATWDALELTVRFRDQRVHLHHDHDHLEVSGAPGVPLLLPDAQDDTSHAIPIVLRRRDDRWAPETRR